MDETDDCWLGEDDGTALICDGDAVLPVRPFAMDSPSQVLADSARVLGALGRRVLAQTPGRMQPFVWLEEKYDANSEAEDQEGQGGQSQKSDGGIQSGGTALRQ